MTRSSWLRLILDADRTLRGARRAGMPPPEFAAVRREALDRRRFLKASGALAGAAMATSCVSNRGAKKDKAGAHGRIVIVGAGLAGLHCAYRLDRAGLQADVFDASSRPGGRCHSDRSTFPDGQSCELGGELIDTGHETMRNLAQEFDLALDDFEEDSPELARSIAFFDGRRLSPAEILEGWAPIAEAVDRSLAIMGTPDDGVWYGEPNGGESLDRMSIREWLDANAPRGVVREFLEVAYLTEYGLETDRSNALNFLTMISTDRDKLEIFGESDERFRVRKGNDMVATSLHGALDAGRFRWGARLVRLAATSDGRYTLTFQRDGTSFEERADHVVLAIPFSILREVELDVELAPHKRQAIRELGYGQSSKLMAGFRSRPWRAQGSNGEVFTDLPFQCTWETSRMQPGASGILTNFTGGNHAVAVGEGSATKQLGLFLDGLEQVFPGVKAASNGKVVRMHWPSNPLTRGSYSSYLVGQYSAFAGTEIERAGNLHFCGEHTSVDAQGFMEGAVLTGAMAAAEVAQDYGIELESAALLAPERAILARARSARANRSWIRALARKRRSAHLLAAR